MPDRLSICVYAEGQLQLEAASDGPVEFGRESDGQDRLHRPLALPGGGLRVAVAPWKDQRVSRQHAGVRPAGAGGVRVENLSQVRGLEVEGHGTLPPQSAREPTHRDP